MGLTTQSTGINAFLAELRNNPESRTDAVVALAGNPNTGKSTVFNGLTGLKQHTGNWPGKTVVLAKGRYEFRGKRFTLVDLPGSYSLLAGSADEQVARDFVCFGRPDAVVVVADATCLERNLNLVLQVTEITPRTVLCLNLIDEAARKGICTDHSRLAELLGIPVVPTAARDRVGLKELKAAIHDLVSGVLPPHPIRLAHDGDIEAALEEIHAELADLLRGRLDSRWAALRLLDGDPSLIGAIKAVCSE